MRARQRSMLAAGLALAMVAAAAAADAPSVMLASGASSPAGLPYSRFVSVAVGSGGDLAVLAATTGVFRAVATPTEVRAEAVFVPGDQLDGRLVIGADAPAQAQDGCVVARLAFADGGAAVYRRCGDAVERVAGVGDVIEADTIRTIDATVVTGNGGHVAVSVGLADGSAALLRGGTGPLVVLSRTGDASPAGGTFSSFRVIGIRGDGTVGFGATVADGPDGLFEWSGGVTRKVLVAGDEVSLEEETGTTIAVYESIEGASMNDGGIFAFVGEIDTSAGGRGVFRVDARPATPVSSAVARIGDPIPGITGGTFGRFQTSTVPAINAAGDVAFRVTLSGEATGAGIFLAHAGGALDLIATTRDEIDVTPVVAAPDGKPVKTTLTRLRDPAIADDGGVVVVSTPPGEGVGLFEVRDGEVGELIRFGAPADLGGIDQRFRFVLPSVVATSAAPVFLGQHEVLLAIDPGGQVRVVAQLGQETSVRGTFSEIDLPGVGTDGRVAFRGEVLGGKTGQGVFVDAGKGPRAIAKAGRAAPGPGRYRDFPATVNDLSASVDVAGTRVAFLASLFDSSAFEGIFLKGKGKGGKSLARTNKKAPGGGQYVSVDVPSVLDRKHYAFTGLVRDDSTRQGLFWQDGPKAKIVVRQGLESGTRIGGRFQAFLPPDLGPGGVLFRAQLSPAGLDGIFVGQGTRRGVLVASGDVTDEGETLRSFDRPAWAADDVVFTASVAGVPAARGLFMLTPAGLPLPDDPQRPVTTLLREGGDAPGGGRVTDVRLPAATLTGLVAAIVRVEGGPAEQLVVRLPLATPPSP